MISEETDRDNVGSWLDHPFGSFLLSGKYADGILRVTSTQGTCLDLPIHRVILSSQSLWFDRLFSSAPHVNHHNQTASLPLWHIEIAQGQESAVQACIEYAYISQPRITLSNWLPVLQLSHLFELPGLSSLAREFIRNNLGDEFFSDMNLDQWAEVLWTIVASLYSIHSNDESIHQEQSRVEGKGTESEKKKKDLDDVEHVLDRAVQVSEKEVRGICRHLQIANPRLGFLQYLVILCALQFQKDLHETDTEKSQFITNYLVNLVDVHDWSEKEISWGLEDGVIDSALLLHQLEQLQLDSIKSQTLGFDNNPDLERKVLKGIENRDCDLLDLMERQGNDPDQTIKPIDYLSQCKTLKKGDTSLESTQLTDDAENELDYSNRLQNREDFVSHGRDVQEVWELQRKRSSSAETLPEKTIWDESFQANQTCIYAPKPQRNHIKPPDFVSNEKLLEFIEQNDNSQGPIYGVSFTSSFMKKENINQEYHCEGGLLPSIPYAPESDSSLVDTIHQTISEKMNSVPNDVGYSDGDELKPTLQYSVWSGDTNPMTHLAYSNQESFYQKQAYQESGNLSLDRDSTPKATLLNPHYQRTSRFHHTRYYSEAQYSNTATMGSFLSSQSSTVTMTSGVRSIHPVSALPNLPPLHNENARRSNSFLKKSYLGGKARRLSFSSVKSSAADLFSMIPNHKRGMKTYDLEKQQRASWQYSHGVGNDLGQVGSGHQGGKKKSLIDYFKVLF